MPLQKETIRSRYFKDISMSFKVNPINYDLISISNEVAIARSIRNLVLTQRGERFFQPNLGSNISNSLFENIDNISAATIRSSIEDVINRNEPRVTLREVIVSPNFENNQFDVSIVYEIVGIDIPAQQLQFVVEPTR